MTTPWNVLAPVSGLFAFGALMIGLFGARARRPGAAGELWRYYASTGLIVAAILLPAALHPLLFTLAVAAAAWRCMVELAVTYGLAPPAPLRAVFPLAALAAAWAGAAGKVNTPPLILLALAVPAYFTALRAQPRAGRSWPAVLLFPLLTAACLAQLIHRDEGFLWIFLLYATVETQDSMAFLFGRLFGRHPVLPRLSPRKTSEGVLAGAAFGVGIGALLAHKLLGQPLADALMLAVLLVIAGLAGDLFTSRLKRVAGIKDFPAVLALHGGLLDIYDSTLFAAIPLALVLGMGAWGIA